MRNPQDGAVAAFFSSNDADAQDIYQKQHALTRKAITITDEDNNIYDFDTLPDSLDPDTEKLEALNLAQIMASDLARLANSNRQVEDYSKQELPPAQDAPQLYRQDIHRVELLSLEEVVHLAQRIERGRLAQQSPPAAKYNRHLIEDGEEAKRQLIEANLRLVVFTWDRGRRAALPWDACESL